MQFARFFILHRANTKIEKIFDKKLIKKNRKKIMKNIFEKKKSTKKNLVKKKFKKKSEKKIPHNFLMVFRTIKNDPGGLRSLK